MVLFMILLAALNVGNFNAPLTAEEQATKACHQYCDDVETRINVSRAHCRNMVDNKTCNNDFSTNDAEYFQSSK